MIATTTSSSRRVKAANRWRGASGILQPVGPWSFMGVGSPWARVREPAYFQL